MTERVRSIWALGVLAGMLCLLTACSEEDPKVTIGKEFPFARIGAIKRGVSTERDVLELLGEPLEKEEISDHEERWRYYMKKERRQMVLWVIPTKSLVTENEFIVLLDGSIVKSIEKDSQSYEE